MVGYIVLEFTYIKLNADKKIVQVFKSIIWWNLRDFFGQIFFITIFKIVEVCKSYI
jgi:hypothetical protein